MSEPSAKRVWRWWHWAGLILLLLLVILVGGALALSVSAKRTYHEALETWRSRGYPDSEEKIRQTQTSSIDLSLIADWQAIPWTDPAVEDLGDLPQVDTHEVSFWLLGDGPEPLCEVYGSSALAATVILDAAATPMRPLERILDQPKFCLNWSAFRSEALVQAAMAGRDMPSIYDVKAVEHYDIRHASRWLAWRCLLDDDPTVAMQRFQRLVEALQRPHGWADGMVMTAAMPTRDRAMLLRIRMGTCPSFLAESWLQEDWDLDYCVTSILAAESAIFTQGFGRLVVEDQIWPEGPDVPVPLHSAPVHIPGVRWGLNAIVPHDVGRTISYEADVLDWWRSGSALTIPSGRAASDECWLVGKRMIAWRDGSLGGLWWLEAHHRSQRIAARIILAQQAGQAAPATTAAALKDYPDLVGDARRATLRYETISGGFRIGIDPATPELIPGAASYYHNRWHVEVQPPSAPPPPKQP